MNVLEKILAFNNIKSDNVKIRLMAGSPFVFFRGTSHLFFETLANYKNIDLLSNEKLICYIQGDAHINNLGFSNKRCSSVSEVRFDINDFDEAFIGNPFLDVIRFAVSIGFFFDELNNSKDERLRDIELIQQDFKMIEYFLEKYLKYASTNEHIEYDWEDSKFMSKMRKKALKRIDITNPKSRINKFTKLLDNNHRVFDYDNKELSFCENKEELFELLSTLPFKIIDICKRESAGVGSAHLERYYILVKNNLDEYLLLELKEQNKPSYLNYFSEFSDLWIEDKAPSEVHIEAKQKMILDYDMHLYSISYQGKNFLLKSVFNAKYSVDAEKFFGDDLSNFEKNLKSYLKFCAIALSNAHKQSSIDSDFIYEMEKIKDKKENKLVSLVFKLYAINLVMFSHFKRDLELN